MAFAFGYFNVAEDCVEGDSNTGKLTACLTYENATATDDAWSSKQHICSFGQHFDLPGEKQKFLKFVRSKLWFTYRKGFSAIGGTGPTSDTGWGCMLRCGQMMLAQALLTLSVQQDWLWTEDAEKHPLAYQKILHQFKDDKASCYSIHQVAQMGVAEGKEVGQWFGPNTIAQVLKRLSQFDKENIFVVHVAMDNTVCIDEIEKLCNVSTTSSCTHVSSDSPGQTNEEASANSSNSANCESNECENEVEAANRETNESDFFWKPLLLVVPLRLGLSEINPVYFNSLKESLEWEESVGIIGGKPNHAYYFFGYTDDNALIFLDPHTTQPFVKLKELDAAHCLNDGSYHCEAPCKMPLLHLDPSLAVAYICETRESFQRLCNKAQSFKMTPTSLPLFEVIQSMPSCGVVESRILSIKSFSREKRRTDGQTSSAHEVTCLALDSDESLESDEEFEILDVY